MPHSTLMALTTRASVAVLLVGLAAGVAQAADTPPSLAGATVVAAEQVQGLQAAGAVVIDTRVASEYADGHLPGARSVPYREKSEKSTEFDAGKDEFNLGKLPADKAASIVMYCNGPECWKSYKATVVAIRGGYTGIRWYRGGFPDWKARGLPTE